MIGLGRQNNQLIFLALQHLSPHSLQTPAEKLWKRWAFVEGEKAHARKERAAYGELTPTYIDTELKYGLFAGATNGKHLLGMFITWPLKPPRPRKPRQWLGAGFLFYFKVSTPHFEAR